MILTTSQLTISRGKKILCNNWDLKFNSGEMWGVLGKNGSGKSTLLLTLAGLHPADKGEIRLNGNLIHKIAPQIKAQHIGILLQQGNIAFPVPIKDFILTSRYPHVKNLRNASATDLAKLQTILRLLELEELQHKNGANLSGGELQRVRIAALLTQSPDIYCLDEPLQYLDLHQQIKIMQLFKNLALQEDKTIICSLHDINLAERFCDKILVFVNDTCLMGETNQVLSSAVLEKIYQHDFQDVITENGRFWLAS